MPAKKKDPSVRARRNKSATRATLKRTPLRPVEDLSDLTVVELRQAIDELNLSRPPDQKVATSGAKAALIERLAAANSPVPAMPPHPPRFTDDGERVEVNWDAQTVAWWNDVWTSPMANEWDESDEHNVMVVALLYDDIWTAATPKARKDALAEYRLQRADLGLSPYSRRRLEWTIEVADAAKDQGKKRRASTGTPPAPAEPGSPEAVDPRSVLSLVN